jgi:hypothetical protein
MKKFINSRSGKISYFVVGLAAILTIMFFVVNNSKLTASLKAPKIIFKEDVHDFGKVPKGPELQYNFKFTNKGNAPLVIERVQTSCGCTGATVGDKKEYLKNESGEIKVNFSTQGREGHQEKTITIYSNDPENPQKTISITCEIDPNMEQ